MKKLQEHIDNQQERLSNAYLFNIEGRKTNKGYQKEVHEIFKNIDFSYGYDTSTLFELLENQITYIEKLSEYLEQYQNNLQLWYNNEIEEHPLLEALQQIPTSDVYVVGIVKGMINELNDEGSDLILNSTVIEDLVTYCINDTLTKMKLSKHFQFYPNN